MNTENVSKEQKGNDVNHVLVAGLFYFGTALDVAGHSTNPAHVKTLFRLCENSYQT